MITYEQLLDEAAKNNLITKEKNLPISKGRIKGNRIAIQKNMPEREKKCVLAEELGHYYTGCGDIMDQSIVANVKQELRGRAFAYNKVVGLSGIISAYQRRCQDLAETAEYLDVTEELLQDSIEYYRNKYGQCVTTDDYIIFFEPNVAVLELMQQDYSAKAFYKIKGKEIQNARNATSVLFTRSIY